jgi:hypothetical protein
MGVSYYNKFKGSAMWNCGMSEANDRTQRTAFLSEIMNIQVHRVGNY